MRVVQAISSHHPDREEENGRELLKFDGGELIGVFHEEDGWAAGRMNNGTKGWFPIDYVKEIEIDWDDFKSMSDEEKKAYLADALVKHLAQREKEETVVTTTTTENEKENNNSEIVEPEPLAEEKDAGVENVESVAELIKKNEKIIKVNSTTKSNKETTTTKRAESPLEDLGEGAGAGAGEGEGEIDQVKKTEAQFVVEENREVVTPSPPLELDDLENEIQSQIYSLQPSKSMSSWKPLSSEEDDPRVPSNVAFKSHRERSHTRLPTPSLGEIENKMGRRNTGILRTNSKKNLNRFFDRFPDHVRNMKDADTPLKKLKCSQNAIYLVQSSVITKDSGDRSYLACRLNIAIVIKGIKEVCTICSECEKSLASSDHHDYCEGGLRKKELDQLFEKVVQIAKSCHECVKKEALFDPVALFGNCDSLTESLGKIRKKLLRYIDNWESVSKTIEKKQRLERLERQAAGNRGRTGYDIDRKEKQAESFFIEDVHNNDNNNNNDDDEVDEQLVADVLALSRGNSMDCLISNNSKKEKSLGSNVDFYRQFQTEVIKLQELQREMKIVVREMRSYRQLVAHAVASSYGGTLLQIPDSAASSRPVSPSTTHNNDNDNDNDNNKDDIEQISETNENNNNNNNNSNNDKDKDKTTTLQKQEMNIEIRDAAVVKGDYAFESAPLPSREPPVADDDDVELLKLIQLCNSFDENADNAVKQISVVMSLISESNNKDDTYYVKDVTEIVKCMLGTIKFASQIADVVGKGSRSGITKTQMQVNTSIHSLVSVTKITEKWKEDRAGCLESLMSKSCECLRGLYDLQGAVYIAFGVFKGGKVGYPDYYKTSYLQTAADAAVDRESERKAEASKTI